MHTEDTEQRVRAKDDQEKETSAKIYQSAQDGFVGGNLGGNMDGKSQMSRTQPSAMYRAGAHTKSHVGGLASVDLK